MHCRWERRYLIEIHEQSWCPAVVRDGATDNLRFIATVARQYRNVVGPLGRALAESRSERIVDLCSGGGGPWPQLHRALNAASPASVPILLTDLHPNLDAVRRPSRADAQIQYFSKPVDATNVPEDLPGFRTLFTSFHHFAPVDARRILQDAVAQEVGIGVFEQTARTPLAVAMMLVLPWLALLVAPFIQPFRIDRLFFTWIVPLIPLVLCVDGIVSCLRSYSPEEMRGLIDELEAPSSGGQYRWEIGRLPSPLSPIGVTYLIGYPVRADDVPLRGATS